MSSRWCLAVLLVPWGCATEGDQTTPAPVVVECGEHELALPDGSCIRPGVAADGCGEGFVHDGEFGCNTVLPPNACPPGLLAMPGDTSCRPVAACGSGRWGDIPIDAATIHVDASFVGVSDGSADAPWTRIGDALATASAGALVAIAAGRYMEDVLISGRPLRMWGVCPEKVEVVGTGFEIGAVFVEQGADGTELHGFAASGAGMGITVSGSENVAIDRVWVHDTASRGADIEGTLGPTSSEFTGSLVESATEIGIHVSDARVLIEGVNVRATRERAASYDNGFGINVQLRCGSSGCDPARRASVEMRGSVVEQNANDGVVVMASDAVIESSVIRDTQPSSTQEEGRGLRAQLACWAGVCDASARANVRVLSSVIERNHFAGVSMSGSDATIENSVVRGTLPQPSSLENGYGVYARVSCTDAICDPATRATLLMRSSSVVDNHDHGILVVASDATMEAVLVRGTVPRPLEQAFGRGVVVQSCSTLECGVLAPGSATVRGSLIERNHEVGIGILGSAGVVEDSVVRQTLSIQGGRGLGIGTGLDCTMQGCEPLSRPGLEVRNVIVEDSVSIGISLWASDATVEQTVVRGTNRDAMGAFGDGISTLGHGAPASSNLHGVRIENSARAALSAFGGTVSIADTLMQCAAFWIEGEQYDARPFQIANGGGNACGCPQPDGDCKVVSAGLAPPDPLAPAQ